MTEQAVTNKEIGNLKALLQQLAKEIAERQQSARFHENWNFYNHLESLHSAVGRLRGELNSKMLDAEAWRAG